MVYFIIHIRNGFICFSIHFLMGIMQTVTIRKELHMINENGKFLTPYSCQKMLNQYLHNIDLKGNQITSLPCSDVGSKFLANFYFMD